MKNLFLLLFIALTLSASAFKVEYRPKSGANTFGIVSVKKNNFAPGQPAIIFLHGIGERGDGSQAGLNKLANWGGVNLKGDKYSLFAATDAFGFNIVCVQTASEYQYGEINYAVDYAIKELKADPNQVHVIANSLGGFGLAREAGKDPALPKRFASMLIIVMGNGTGANTAKNIADSKVPTWFMTASDDTKSGTNPDVTRKLFSAVDAAGGNTWLTDWPTGGHGMLTRAVGSWYPPLGWSMPAAKGTSPVMPIYKWMLNNRKGGAVKTPTDPYVPFMPEPVKLPAKEPAYILYNDGTWSPV
ncbi:MAG TPA: hypothetical protein PK339_12385 [Flavitalea sp.]|nr:hypothetical protein [Flavitalea sp.]